MYWLRCVWPSWVGITLPANWCWTFPEWPMMSESINKLACVPSGLKEKRHPLLKASRWPLLSSVLSLALLQAFFSPGRCERSALRNAVSDRILLLLMVLVELAVAMCTHWPCLPCWIRESEVYQKEFLQPSFLLINMHLHIWQRSLKDYADSAILPHLRAGNNHCLGNKMDEKLFSETLFSQLVV